MSESFIFRSKNRIILAQSLTSCTTHVKPTGVHPATAHIYHSALVSARCIGATLWIYSARYPTTPSFRLHTAGDSDRCPFVQKSSECSCDPRLAGSFSPMSCTVGPIGQIPPGFRGLQVRGQAGVKEHVGVRCVSPRGGIGGIISNNRVSIAWAQYNEASKRRSLWASLEWKIRFMFPLASPTLRKRGPNPWFCPTYTFVGRKSILFVPTGHDNLEEIAASK